ncbi:WhiB family transcription factor [Gordonia phage Rabbitrun]|uniref:WhiB family transcription factor n=1 Tax=Gordonia phage Rabbitrun TaxID=2762280 RepID=A0A7G8LIN4_9CAUD|nr:WhiB family transcription factor [Gordonia phage Rabbitrun]QNJ57106.1 WhiB family transcription factor [Gordonia phage Rabbitrun]
MDWDDDPADEFDEQRYEPWRAVAGNEAVNEFAGGPNCGASQRSWAGGGKCATEDPRFWDMDFYKDVNEDFRPKLGTAMMVDPNFSLAASIRGEAAPLVRDTHGTNMENMAERLCRGCPVLSRCAANALEPMYFTSPKGNAVFQSGVIRAGVPMATERDRSTSPLSRRTIERLTKASDTGVSGGW